MLEVAEMATKAAILGNSGSMLSSSQANVPSSSGQASNADVRNAAMTEVGNASQLAFDGMDPYLSNNNSYDMLFDGSGYLPNDEFLGTSFQDAAHGGALHDPGERGLMVWKIGEGE